jgi:hypothetical protein
MGTRSRCGSDQGGENKEAERHDDEGKADGKHDQDGSIEISLAGLGGIDLGVTKKSPPHDATS